MNGCKMPNSLNIGVRTGDHPTLACLLVFMCIGTYTSHIDVTPLPAYGPECSIAVMAKRKQASLLKFVQEGRY